MDVGQRIRELRAERGLTMRELSDRSGLAENSIARIERGERQPSMASIEALARGLEATVGDLFSPLAGAPPRSVEAAAAGESRLAEEERRVLAGIRPVFKLMHDTAGYLEELAGESFDPGECRQAIWFTSNLMGQLNEQLADARRQGVDPIAIDPIKAELDETLSRLAAAQQAALEAASRAGFNLEHRAQPIEVSRS